MGGAEGPRRQARRGEGSRHRRGRRSARRRLDRLRRPDDHSTRRQAVRPVGRRQSRHALVHRPGPRRRRRAGHALGQGRRELGQHREEPAVELHVGRQSDDARDDAGESGGRDRRAVETAGDRREGSRRLASRLHTRQRARLSPREPGERHDVRAGRRSGRSSWAASPTVTSSPPTCTRSPRGRRQRSPAPA